MENAPEDKKVKGKIFVACQTKLKELSRMAAELSGPAVRIWNQQLESISSKILSAPVIPRAMKLLANNARDEIPAAISGDFIATVIEVSKDNTPSPDESWRLLEKWPSDKVEIPIEILPGAWRVDSAKLPALCLVFGRLFPNEDIDAKVSNSGQTSSSLVLKVHFIVPR